MKKRAKIGPRGYRRHRVGTEPTDADGYTLEPLYPDSPYPMVLRPSVRGTSLTEWAAHHAETIEELLWRHRSLLFRDFDLGGVEGFGTFVGATSTGEPLPYRDRSTPRRAYGKNVYCTTIFPPEMRIRLHNEGSYWRAWAQKAYFGCITAPPTGGETPIGDVHRVHERLPERIRAPFRRHGVMYVRNYNDGLGLPWQEVFQTEDEHEVEAYCRANDIAWEWKEGGRLRTRTIRPAIRTHPRTGEALWFNHAAFFHASALEPATREAMVAALGEDGLPYQTYLGNGGPIPDADVSTILKAYDDEEIAFRWQEGDVHLIDNMRLAHARSPYAGERLILVALTEPTTGGEELPVKRAG